MSEPKLCKCRNDDEGAMTVKRINDDFHKCPRCGGLIVINQDNIDDWEDRFDKEFGVLVDFIKQDTASKDEVPINVKSMVKSFIHSLNKKIALSEDSVKVLKLMIKHYEERGGGYSQMEALKEAINLSKPKNVEIDRENLANIIDKGKHGCKMTGLERKETYRTADALITHLTEQGVVNNGNK